MSELRICGCGHLKEEHTDKGWCLHPGVCMCTYEAKKAESVGAGRAAQGAAPLSNTFDNSGVSVKSIDQLAAPRAEGLALDFDSASALLSAYNYWLNDNPDATVGDRYDWTKRYLARLRAASPLNASGDER